MTSDARLAEVARSALFAESASPYLLLDRNLKIVSANQAYLLATGRARAELQDKHLFDAFPDNPADPGANGVANLGASLDEVLRTGLRCPMWVQRHDIPEPNTRPTSSPFPQPPNGRSSLRQPPPTDRFMRPPGKRRNSCRPRSPHGSLSNRPPES